MKQKSNVPWWVTLIAPVALILSGVGMLLMDDTTGTILGPIFIVIGFCGVVLYLGPNRRGITK